MTGGLLVRVPVQSQSLGPSSAIQNHSPKSGSKVPRAKQASELVGLSARLQTSSFLAAALYREFTYGCC